MLKKLDELKVGEKFIFTNDLNLRYAVTCPSGGITLKLFDDSKHYRDRSYPNPYVIENDVLMVTKRNKKSIVVNTPGTFKSYKGEENCYFRLPFNINQKSEVSVLI